MSWQNIHKDYRNFSTFYSFYNSVKYFRSSMKLASKAFVSGYGIQMALSLLSGLSKMSRSPKGIRSSREIISLVCSTSISKELGFDKSEMLKPFT